MAELFLVGLLVFVIGFFVVVGKLAKEQAKRDALCTEVVVGKVIDLEKVVETNVTEDLNSVMRESILYYPIVEYWVDGVEYRVRARFSKTKFGESLYKVGDVASVKYNPGEPGQSYVESIVEEYDEK